MDDRPSKELVTSVLRDWRDGDRDALDRLTPLVYEELRRLAASQMRGERHDHTLQPTALVHEAFARLVDAEVPWQDRGHFFSTAARMMRRILVDHARAKRRDKRGGDWVQVTLEGLGVAVPDIVPLDQALQRLAEHDPRKATIIDLSYFAGLTQAEIAKTLDVSLATVERDLRFARAWLRNELS